MTTIIYSFIDNKSNIFLFITTQMEKEKIERAKDVSTGAYKKMGNRQMMRQEVPIAQHPQQERLPPNNANQEHANDDSCLKKQQPSKHLQALAATIILIVGASIGLVLYFNNISMSLWAYLAIYISSYLLYLIVACCCSNPLTKYLKNISKGEKFENDYQYLRKKVGKFVLHAEGYHWESTTHQDTWTDSDGHTRTTTYTTTDKVVTHTATQQLQPRETVDQSGAINQIKVQTKIVFIHYYVKYRFIDPQSQRKFNTIYENFKSRNIFDIQQSFSFKYDFPGFFERKAYFIGELNCNYFCWYYLFGAFGMLWPYSLWVESKIRRFKVEAIKAVRI